MHGEGTRTSGSGTTTGTKIEREGGHGYEPPVQDTV